MFQSAKEQRITEKINNFRKRTVKQVVKKVKPKKRVDTSAEKKRNEMLDILNSKIKSSIKLEKVFKLLNEKQKSNHHTLRNDSCDANINSNNFK